MADAIEIEHIGNTTLAVLIPSRYGDLSIIDPNLIEQARIDTKSFLDNRFGGTSEEKEQSGSFYDENYSLSVNEQVIKIFTTVKDEKLADKQLKEQTFDLAKKLCTDLSQVCIGIYWGRDLYFIYSDNHNDPKPVPFKKLSKQMQDIFTVVAIRELKTVGDIRSILALDGWKIEENCEPERDNGLHLIGTKSKRKSWATKQAMKKHEIDRKLPNAASGDLAFDLCPQNGIGIWINDKTKGFRGPQYIRLVGGDGKVERKSYEIAQSILNASDSEKLIDIIDRQAITAKFFDSLKTLRGQLTNAFRELGLPKSSAQREAQRTLGRLMVIRFLEKQGSLGEDKTYLKTLYKKGKRPKNTFYNKSLYRLFHDELDTPITSRKFPSSIPYMNGGLFEATEHAHLLLEDSLFDPDQPHSILSILYKYDFTLAEGTDVQQLASIDPSMLGLVLEGLCTPEQRKQEGIHYTPPSISTALAEQGILSAISNKTKITTKAMKLLINGQHHQLASSHMEQIEKAIRELRIIDPAVGSGSLLMACFNTLMVLYEQCEAHLAGNPPTKISPRWKKQALHLIQHCLFGVDIDADAIDIARLRFWLALAVADAVQINPLPDLTRNLQVGDSLSALDAYDAHIITNNERVLEFSRDDELENERRDAIRDYHSTDAQTSRDARKRLRSIEQELYLIQTGSDSSPGQIPFRWQTNYQEIFNCDNGGFDLVIANPPYISIQNQVLSAEKKREYRSRFKTLDGRNRDLYYAFIEQALALAGKEGQIAFVMPNFSKTQSGKEIRNILEARGAISLWVDFADYQVFKDATNYVALLFGSSKKRKTKRFDVRVPSKTDIDLTSDDWLERFQISKANYQCLWGHIPANENHISGDIHQVWRICNKQKRKRLAAIEHGAVPISILATVEIGVQTSKDEVFLVEEIARNGKQVTIRSSARKLKPFVVEASGLVKLVKGAKDIKPFRFTPRLCIWPYAADGTLLTRSQLETRTPNTWKYLQYCEKTLRAREKGKFDKDEWWSFRRPQGVRIAKQANKVLVPSIMKPATAVCDINGDLAYTASGTGGGGAWGIVLQPNEQRVTADWICACLNSSVIWEWFEVEADYKQNGWRGVDQEILQRVPIAIGSRKEQGMISNLISTMGENADSSIMEKIDEIIIAAYS